MGNIKQINIENRTYNFFNDMINIEKFDSNSLKINKKSYKSVGIYYIGYITIKRISDYENINNVYSVYLIIDKAEGYIECNSIGETNRNKYLTFASTEKNKEVLKKYRELWNGIKYLIECNSIKADEYEKDFMKIKFNSDVNLPLNKKLKLQTCFWKRW